MRKRRSQETETWHYFARPVLNRGLIFHKTGRMILISKAFPEYGDIINIAIPREKYRRVLVIDGNFKGDHVRMRDPQNDVPLTNGEGYVVEESRYLKHLAGTKEVKQVYPLISMSVQYNSISL